MNISILGFIIGIAIGCNISALILAFDTRLRLDERWNRIIPMLVEYEAFQEYRQQRNNNENDKNEVVFRQTGR